MGAALPAAIRGCERCDNSIPQPYMSVVRARAIDGDVRVGGGLVALLLECPMSCHDPLVVLLVARNLSFYFRQLHASIRAPPRPNNTQLIQIVIKQLVRKPGKQLFVVASIMLL